MMVKVTWPRVILGVAVLATLGLTVAWLGLINIGASSGHWAITDKFLHWTMRNAVRTQSALTVEEPASDPTGLVSAAGHYAAACAFCHGEPGGRLPPVMQAATPPVPDLARTVGSWNDRQLFWIIKHGVKFTAMPAWPAQSRDDEVRRMVAFVRRLPAMSEARYRALAYGPRTGLVGIVAGCARCHGADGLGRGQPDIPVLAGQKPAYLAATLAAYASGLRPSGVMQAAAAALDSATILDLARHYAARPGLKDASNAPPAGIVARGLPQANLPACSRCHAPGKRPLYPRLYGQKASYIAARLRLWRGDAAVVEARKPDAVMPVIARRIPEEAIGPLARHFEGTNVGVAFPAGRDIAAGE